jgi:hypothetical protein
MNVAGTNTGHGHVWPRPDGLRARCGGPGLCAECATDQAATKNQHVCCHHVAATKHVLADRERELLSLKGPCSSTLCRLHFAHSGPCDAKSGAEAVSA